MANNEYKLSYTAQEIDEKLKASPYKIVESVNGTYLIKNEEIRFGGSEADIGSVLYGNVGKVITVKIRDPLNNNEYEYSGEVEENITYGKYGEEEIEYYVGNRFFYDDDPDLYIENGPEFCIHESQSGYCTLYICKNYFLDEEEELRYDESFLSGLYQVDILLNEGVTQKEIITKLNSNFIEAKKDENLDFFSYIFERDMGYQHYGEQIVSCLEKDNFIYLLVDSGYIYIINKRSNFMGFN